MFTYPYDLIHVVHHNAVLPAYSISAIEYMGVYPGDRRYARGLSHIIKSHIKMK